MKPATEQLPHCYPADDFYAQAKGRLQQLRAGDHLSLIMLDFDHFNYINDLFGYETGDFVLQAITRYFSQSLSDGEFFSRVHADHFAFCLGTLPPNVIMQRLWQLADLKDVLRDYLPLHYSMAASGGVVTVTDDSASLSSLLDKANYARKKAKGGSLSKFLFYDAAMDGELEWQKTVTLGMESALRHRQFEMYLQPKVLLQTGQVVGAEALVRWNSPTEGLITPNRFIPVMEQNGFVCQLDFFILKEACRFLQSCALSDRPCLPVSVNFSKKHLASDRLAERIFQTVHQTGIEPRLIEIEFTENLYLDDFQKLIEVTQNLKSFGFHVSLDDFGSAYSSLNCLKDLPVDIVKIDKGFLNASTNTEQGQLIIAKMVELIKSLRKTSVMEGVENFQQVEFLEKLCCDLGQGYFYARPMPVPQFLEYLDRSDVLTDLQPLLNAHLPGADGDLCDAIPQEFRMDNWDLYTLGKNIDIGLMKGYLDKDASVQYVNDRALEYLGYTRQEFREQLHNRITAFTHPDDVSLVLTNVHRLKESGRPLSFQTRALRKDGREIIFKGSASCVADSQGRPIGIYTFQDVTVELESTQALQSSLQEKINELEFNIVAERQIRDALRVSEERYRVIMDQSDDIMFEWDFDSDFITFSGNYREMFGTAPITESIATNPAARAKIHPEDLGVFEQWVRDTYQKSGQSSAQFRVRDAQNNYIWVRYRSTAICNASGRPVKAVGVFSNITAQKKQVDQLTLKSQLDPLTKLLNKEETSLRIDERIAAFPHVPGALLLIDIDNFKGLNDTLGHQLGDKVLTDIAAKAQTLFPDGIIGRIGGDEIAVYTDGDEAAVQASAQALAQALRMSYYGSHEKYDISGSIGVALYPAHARLFIDLYRLADTAMYESKRTGKDRCTLYYETLTGALRNNETPVEWTEGFLSAYFQNDFPFRVFQMLYETKDMNASINMILELLGTRYQVDRVYIFQNSEDDTAIHNTFEWCAPHAASQIGALQNMPLHNMGVYFEQYSSEGVFHCTNVDLLEQPLRDVFAARGIRSLLHCAISNEGHCVGFIGFDMCALSRSWSGEEIAILGYISRILSVFLIKTNTAAELRVSNQNYRQMLENLNGFVYVIDAKTYELLYINTATRSLGVEPSGPCYRAAFGIDAPCPNCPMNKFSDTVHYNTEEIYSKLLDTWVNSAASKVRWGGMRDAVLVCCTDISRYKKHAE